MATFRQLEYFVTLVDEGSFTRAAARLGVTQPGLSHQFRALEEEVGSALVERLPRALRLTPAGRAMLPFARSALVNAERGTAAARRAAGLASGELHVATLYSISHGVLPEALALWRGRHPGMRVTLFEYAHTSHVVESMTAGHADVAIGPAPEDWPGVVRELGSEEFFLVASADATGLPPHGARIRLADLTDREWVLFTQDSGLADFVDQACAGAGFRPTGSVRTRQAPAAAAFAATGTGVALVPGNVIPEHFPGRLLRPEPPLARRLTAYTRASPDPASSAFLDLLRRDIPLTPGHIRALFAGSGDRRTASRAERLA
ncbi:LysR family transcriptional regulator [Streptomyces sp. ZYX-F-203]